MRIPLMEKKLRRNLNAGIGICLIALVTLTMIFAASTVHALQPPPVTYQSFDGSGNNIAKPLVVENRRFALEHPQHGDIPAQDVADIIQNLMAKAEANSVSS